MNVTDYGPGGFAHSAAAVPLAPRCAPISSSSVAVRIASGDGNPDYTEYAIANETDGGWLDGAGENVAEPVWRTREEWGTVAATGLDSAASYAFSVTARNRDGIATAPGPTATIETYGRATVSAPLQLTVVKATSTIAAPVFMAGLAPDIVIAGKDLLDFGFRADTVGGLDMPGIIPGEELVPGAHEWRAKDEYFAPKRIVLEGYIHGEDAASLRLRLAYLKSFLATFDGSPWRSNAPVRLERADFPDRHWTVLYSAVEVLEMLGGRWGSSSARLRITMKSMTPYAVSNETVRQRFTPADTLFESLELGNAPADAVYVIEGPASDPAFSTGDLTFLADFNEGLAFSDAFNETGVGTFTPEGGETASWRVTETGTGISVSDDAAIVYTVCGNPADGSWLVVLIPGWQSTDRATDALVLEHTADADNYIRLLWDAVEMRWTFLLCAGGVERAVSSGMQAFDAGTRIVLGLTYDATNAGGMKLFVDGVLAGTGDGFGGLEETPATLRLGAEAGSDGLAGPDAVYDRVVGWSRMLSADEMRRVSTDSGTVVNRNAAVVYDGDLAEGDILALDSFAKTATVFSRATGTRTNALDHIIGDIPALAPGRRRTATDRTQTVVHTRFAAPSMEVRYRRRYL